MNKAGRAAVINRLRCDEVLFQMSRKKGRTVETAERLATETFAQYDVANWSNKKLRAVARGL